MHNRPLTFYMVMHNSNEEGEEPSFKLEETYKFYIPYQAAGHIFRGIKQLFERVIPLGGNDGAFWQAGGRAKN
jgi:hypothetical protein